MTRRISSMGLGLFLAACSNGGSTAAGNGEDAGSDSPMAPVDCPADALSPGVHSLSFEHDGETRDYTLFVAGGGEEPVPLLLSIHGFTSNAEQHRDVQLTESTNPEEQGFTVVYPNAFAAGVPVEPIDQGWNAGTCCGTPASEGRDDIAFFRALVDEVSSLTCIDPRRVYSSGMSNGGFMSHRLACEASDLVAAIASVAGVLGIPPADCAPSRPVPVLQIHGLADRVVPVDGGQTVGIAPFASLGDTIDNWKDDNGCAGDPVETYRQGAATCHTYQGCDEGAEVVDCRIEGFDHCWPGAADCALGDQTRDLSANAQLLGFLPRFALP